MPDGGDIQAFRHVPILIAGGGVAGLATGIALRRAGLNPLIVERLDWSTDKIPPLIKGEFLQPLGVDLLHKQDSFKYLKNCVRIHNISHQYLHPLLNSQLKFQIEFRPPYFGIASMHEDIVRGLRAHYLDLNGELIEGVNIVDYEKIKRGHLTTLEKLVVKSDIFVGCDGRFSLSRKHSKLKLLELPCNRVMIAGLVKNINLPKGEFYTCEVPLGVVYAFSYGETTRVYYCFEKSRLGEALKNKEEFFLNKISTSPLPKHCPLELSGPVLIMPTSDSMLPKRSIGSGIWIGDAAGNLDPLGGYGMSVAIRDAQRVADAIIQNQNKLVDIEEAFENIGTLSLSDYLSARFFSMWIGYLFMGGNRLSRLAKWNALERIKKTPALRDDLIDRFGGLKTEPFAFSDVPYYLGMLPGGIRNRLESIALLNDLKEIQNTLLTTPNPLKKAKVVERLRNIAPSILNF